MLELCFSATYVTLVTQFAKSKKKALEKDAQREKKNALKIQENSLQAQQRFLQNY